MNEELIRKKFVVVLERWMNSESLNQASLAWLLDVCPRTIHNWLTGFSMPGGRNAILLSYFADPVRPVLQKWAGVDGVEARYAEHVNKGKKAA